MPALAGDLAVRHKFPDHIVIEGCGMLLVEDDLVRRVPEGDSILGWGGDLRLGVYIDLGKESGRATWNLIRFCEDGKYACLARFDAYVIPTSEIVGVMVLWLIEHDSRRKGFNIEAVHQHNEAIEAARMAYLDEWATEELSPRAMHMVQKEL